MKILPILSHPLIQVVSFCLVLVGSPYFGGPFGYFIYRAMLAGDIFGILGAVGIVLSLVSIFVRQRIYLQLLGLALMLISLLLFFFASTDLSTASTLSNLIPLSSLLLFLSIAVAVVYKNVKTKITA